MEAPMGKGWCEEERLEAMAQLQDLSLASFRHSQLGTRAVLARVGGPLCTLNMFFATESHDDKGLPHCLEHLCFMGSRGYKRGYLDLLATRCGSDGTNAYTSCDHTCYSFEAAGQEGLLAILPVFVDHVLCPLLSEDAFLTEVHHVNGKGERQGVVFSEMLGRVKEEAEVLELERRRATFGDASLYGHEYGGLPDEILKLSREEVAAYHKSVYTTDNLHLLVCGAVDEARLLRELDAALAAAVGRGAGQRCQQRPFVSTLPALPETSVLRRSVQFPSDDVSMGSVAYSHCLEGVAFDATREIAALDCLGRFLTGLVSSPLEQAFVQCEPPVASGITCDVILTVEPHISIELTGVPFRAGPDEEATAERLGEDEAEDDEEEEDDDDGGGEDGEEEEEGGQDEDGQEEQEEDSDEGPDWFDGDALMQKLSEELHKACAALESGNSTTLDELRRAVRKEHVSWRESFEDGPSEFISEALCPHLIFERYPHRQQEGLGIFRARLSALESLMDEPGSWWAERLDRHLLQPLLATLRGERGAAEVRSCPSALLAQRSERSEQRTAKQNAKRLGAKKLKALQERVDKAEKANTISLDEDARARFPPPVRPDCAPDLPWEMELIPAPEGGLEVLEVQVPSAFVELHVAWLLDDAALPGRRGASLQRHLPLFAELLCETGVAGEDYRAVVARLDDELVSYSASLGRNSEFLRVGSQPRWLNLQLSAEPERSTEIVAWADRLAHECDFAEERVLAACRRMVTDLKETMRQGGTVLAQALPCAVYGPLSPQVQFGALSQRRFLERCCSDVEGTCRALRELRDALPHTAAAAVVSGSSAERRRAIVEPLQQAWRARSATARPPLLRAELWGADATPSSAPLLPLRHFAVGCAGADTAHVQLRAPLPLPPVALDGRRAWSLRLLCEGLSMLEGPLSMAIRGKGLAYGGSVGFLQHENAVVLDLWECTNVRKAVEGALEVVRGAIEVLSPFQLDNARGSLVFQVKERRATPSGIVSAAVAAASRGWRCEREVQQWEVRLSEVSLEDVTAVHREYLMRLCDPSQAVACLVCDPGDCKAKAKSLAAALGIEAGSVRVKEKISECYAIVDDCVSAAHDKLAD